MLGLVGLACVPWALTLWTPPPLVYRNVPFPVLTARAYPGDMLPLLVDRCVYGNAPLIYTFTRMLVPDEPGRPGIVMSASGSMAPPGCLTVESRLTELPDLIAPGRYHLEAITTIGGTWKTWQIPWRSEVFEVGERNAP